jgi:hypothetical protein
LASGIESRFARERSAGCIANVQEVVDHRGPVDLAWCGDSI